MYGNDQHGPAGVEERRLDDQPIKGGLLRLRLTKDRQVEPARKTGENPGAVATAVSSICASAAMPALA